MSIDPITSASRNTDRRNTDRAQALNKVLGQCEHVNELVKQSADELLSLNIALQRGLEKVNPHSTVETTIEKSLAVQNKVLDASKQLIVMNRALAREVRDRTLVDHQLAAAFEQEEAARYAAFHDVLTDLPNRALFNDRLKQGLAQSKRNDWAMAVMFMDLGKFKHINDTHGHDVGDIVLQTAAQRLKENTRENDTVSRHGGDEFLYLLTEVRDEKTIAMIAEKIIMSIQAPYHVRAGQQDIQLSIGVSIGISIFPRDGVTADELVKSADKAMYHAKQNNSGYAFAPQAPA